MHVTGHKPSSTSAAGTTFCADKVMGPGGHLWVDGNSKITAGNGTLDAPQPNAFSLVQVSDCPGSTVSCRKSCYVWGLQKHAPDTHALYVHNSAMIRTILDSSETDSMWAAIMAGYIEHHCQGGFRWHVSGDIFSDQYAAWIAKVCSMSPTVRHWIYTRSFMHLFPLYQAGMNNLTINLSADKDNIYAAELVAAVTGYRICYLTEDGSVPHDLPRGSVIFPDYALRGGTDEGTMWFESLPSHQKAFVCPVDYHGKTEKIRCGPCKRCIEPNYDY